MVRLNYTLKEQFDLTGTLLITISIDVTGILIYTFVIRGTHTSGKRTRAQVIIGRKLVPLFRRSAFVLLFFCV